MPWDVRSSNGVWLPQIGWWLDARYSTPRCVVSHAHSDHIARHREVVCTRATARLMQERLPGQREFHVLPFGVPEQLTLDCTVTLLPAGHILGSALVLLEHNEHGSLLYTGDFKLNAGLAAEPCATPPADVLVMETTFGLPRYAMPSASETGATIVGFCRATLTDSATPVLLAYSLGKSQELVRLVGRAGLPVMLHPHAARYTRLYEELGAAMPPHRPFDPQDHRGHVVIAPAGAEMINWINPKRTAAVTGWAMDSRTRHQLGCDEAFPLSDHSDFNELLTFVDRVRPRTVYTVHGFAREFAATLRARGIEAWALGRGNQLELSL
ncbi:MAG: MBL fold metallo-hydrolase [Opitutus sp.]|nr:MBL fold metallo-hydrolase [Opitutus sp.]